jgi:hypothetical protein
VPSFAPSSATVLTRTGSDVGSAKIASSKRKVDELMARAGIIEPPRRGGRRLATEQVVVFRGPHQSDLGVFDQDGRRIGAARRSREGYELSDAEPICTVRGGETTWSGHYFEFSVLSSDGTVVGTVAREKRQKPPSEPSLRDILWATPPSTMGFNDAPAVPIPTTRTPDALLKDRDDNVIGSIWARPRREVTRHRRSAADLITRIHYVLDSSSCSRYSIEDEPGHEAARLTYVRPSFWRNHVSFVLEIQPDVSDPLRTLVFAAPIVVDNSTLLNFWEWGSGGV